MILSDSDLHKENASLIFRWILGIDFKIFTKNLAENSWMLVPLEGRRSSSKSTENPTKNLNLIS